MKRAKISLNYNQINMLIASSICYRAKIVQVTQISVLDETSRITQAISYDVKRIDYLINELEKIREGFNEHSRNFKTNDDDFQD